MKLINDFSFGLFFFQAALIIVLILLLKKYAWGPILSAINNREEGIREAIASAEKAKMDMAELKADNEKLMMKARQERDELLKEARSIKDQLISDATEEAEAKSQSIIEKAKSAIENEKKAALADIKKQVSELSIEIAEKVVKRELNQKENQMQLVDEMLKDVELN